MREQIIQAASGSYAVLEKVPTYGVVRAAGYAAPTNAWAGFAYGAIFYVINATTPQTSNYVNTGSVTSATWQALDFNRQLSSSLVSSGASLTVTFALHNNKTIVLAAAAAITLPAMSGSGGRYRFVMGATATAVTITATAAHLFGTIIMNTDSAFQAGTLFTVGAAVSTAGSTIITFDGSTKGGNKGDWVLIEDVASGIGSVSGILNASGTEATPYS